MSTGDVLRNLFEAAKPLIRESLDLTEQFTELRKAAQKKEVEWSHIKALAKASVQDDEDGGERVKTILARSGAIAAYADLLGLGAKQNFPSRGSSPLGKATAFQAVRDGLDSHGPLQSTRASVSAPEPELTTPPGSGSPNSDDGGEVGEGPAANALQASLSVPLSAAEGRGAGDAAAELLVDDSRMVIGRVTKKLREGDQVPGMPHAICHACGLGYRCSDADCPNDKPNPALVDDPYNADIRTTQFDRTGAFS